MKYDLVIYSLMFDASGIVIPYGGEIISGPGEKIMLLKGRDVFGGDVPLGENLGEKRRTI
jgi:hypothetical protein